MTTGTARGITLPLPGQEKEEPDLWQEDDIPTPEPDEPLDQDPERPPKSA